MKKISFILLLVIAFFSSCENKTEKKTENPQGQNVKPPQPVKTEIDILADSVNAAWKAMIESDDQKFRDIKRLLDEISYTKDYDAVMLEEILKEMEYVKSQRYDETLNLAALDRYDQLTDELIKKVYRLKAKSKEIKQHPLADELVKDINYANSQEITVSLRMRYDEWAKRYNDYLKTNQDKLKEMGDKYASFKERPRFLN
jgi:hypothetical protein